MKEETTISQQLHLIRGNIISALSNTGKLLPQKYGFQVKYLIEDLASAKERVEDLIKDKEE